MKKAIITALAVAVLGTGYFASRMDLKRIPDIARVFDSVVIHRQDFEETILNELAKTQSEGTANNMIEQGYVARKRINQFIRPAPEFARNPYDLRIVIEHTLKGDEAYLFDKSANQKLPVDENNQVGDLKYRAVGVYQDAEKSLVNLLYDAKDYAVKTIDSVIGRFSK